MYKEMIIQKPKAEPKKTGTSKAELGAYKTILNKYMDHEECDIKFEEYQAIVEIENGSRELIILQDVGNYQFAMTRFSKMLQDKWIKWLDKDIKEIEETTRDAQQTEDDILWEYISKPIF